VFAAGSGHVIDYEGFLSRLSHFLFRIRSTRAEAACNGFFTLAHASSSVPSTLKCSSDVHPFYRACPTTRARNSLATSASSNRSRFLVNTVASHNRIIQIQPHKPAKQNML
jgi:hypothetical protein